MYADHPYPRRGCVSQAGIGDLLDRPLVQGSGERAPAQILGCSKASGAAEPVLRECPVHGLAAGSRRVEYRAVARQVRPSCPAMRSAVTSHSAFKPHLTRNSAVESIHWRSRVRSESEPGGTQITRPFRARVSRTLYLFRTNCRVAGFNTFCQREPTNRRATHPDASES